MSSFGRYYLLALLEGIGVISVELLGAKILAPYFGTSLLIWTMVIGITLVALAASYAIGGWMSNTQNRDLRLYWLFGIGATLLGFMPFSGPLLFRIFNGLPLLVSVGLCTFLLLVPPILFFGSTTPLLIQGITQRVEKAGSVSGNIYAISTSGGIITTFALGFYVIPEFGISKPALLAATLLLIVTNLLLPKIMWVARLGLAVILVVPLTILMFPAGNGNGAVSVIFEQEGVLGQVKVVDVAKGESQATERKLLFNGIPQTNVVKGDYSASSRFNYVHMLAMLSSMKPTGSKALICGLGGGSLVMEYQRLGFKTDVIDIDWRLPALAERYFYLDPKAFTFYLDDARHYIQQSEKIYDIITLDIALSEAQPYHLYTVEAFQEFKRKLAPNGLLVTNFQGQFVGTNTLAERSIFRTIQAAGFEVHAVPSVGTGIQDVIFVASANQVPFENLNIRRLNPCCINVASADIFVQDPRAHVISDPDLHDAYILEDDKPLLDILRMPSVLEFRRNKIKSIADKELESDGQLFK